MRLRKSVGLLIIAFVFCALFFEAKTAEADSQANANLENQIENLNSPSFGYEINNYGNNKLMKSIGAVPPSLIFNAPSPTQPYISSEATKVFQGRGYYFPQELYTEKEVVDFIIEKKDIIQTFGKLYDTPIAGEPILLLSEAPENHIDLGGVHFTGPPNGTINETIQRAKAYAYYKFGSQKMVIKVSSLNYNLSSVGNSGGNIGTATIQGEFSHSGGLAPSTGVTASTVYKTPVVEVTCFSNNPVDNFPTSSLNLLEGSRQLLVKDFSTNFSDEQRSILEHNADILSKLVLDNGSSIEVLAFSPSGKSEDIERLEPVVKEVMLIIGSRLRQNGSDEEFLNTIIKAKIAGIKNPQISQILQNDNAVAGIVLNVN